MPDWPRVITSRKVPLWKPQLPLPPLTVCPSGRLIAMFAASVDTLSTIRLTRSPAEPVNVKPAFCPATVVVTVTDDPPAAIDDWRYLGVSLLAGIITFWFPAAVKQQWNPVMLFDAAGLGLFAVSGAHKALAYGLNPIMATLLGMVTGIGGGMARDVLLTTVPTVLRAELYAVAALLGAAVVVGAGVVAVLVARRSRNTALSLLTALGLYGLASLVWMWSLMGR